MKVVAFVPAKGTSDRVPNKNLRFINGKPLFMHTVDKLLGMMDHVWVDSESNEVASYVYGSGATWLKRPEELATNATDGNRMFAFEVSQVKADLYIQHLCTSPFIRPETIQQAITTLMMTNEYDSAIFVRKEKQYLWGGDQPLYDINHIPNSVDLPDTTIETMGLYMVKADSDVILHGARRIGIKPMIVEIDPLEAIDINTPEDFELAELVFDGIKQRDMLRLTHLKSILSSELLSDIMDGMSGNDEYVIKGVASVTSPHKMIGRANTLKLRQLGAMETPEGIYDALQSYRGTGIGDVIVVENEVAHRAYFGQLNSLIAMSKGAVGAVIGGLTRDVAEVTANNFPVFAAGRTCRDVKGEATVDSFGHAIDLFGVAVRPGDLIFGDACGVVVVPQRLEAEVIEKALANSKREADIIHSIAAGADPETLLGEHGGF